MKKIAVLVVDDSPLMRAWLKKILSADPAIGEVTTAQDPLEAKVSLQTKRPDVITLDVEMPGIDGISFLKEIMSTHPLPVVMVSAYTRENGPTTIKALSWGRWILSPNRDLVQKRKKKPFRRGFWPRSKKRPRPGQCLLWSHRPLRCFNERTLNRRDLLPGECRDW